jgi:hypothetical protein
MLATAPMAISRFSAQRMTSLSLVLLLHALLLLLLLHAFTQKSGPRLMPRETILRLLPLLRPTPQTDEAGPRSAGTAQGARPALAPSAPATAPAAPMPDVTGLGFNLFGCAPERLATLTPEERARCNTGLKAPGRDVVIIPKSHVLDPARRAAEMKAKNSPLRIPCTSTGSAPGPYFSKSVTGMIDPGCALRGLVNGFDPLTGEPK